MNTPAHRVQGQHEAGVERGGEGGVGGRAAPQDGRGHLHRAAHRGALCVVVYAWRSMYVEIDRLIRQTWGVWVDRPFSFPLHNPSSPTPPPAPLTII